MKLTVLLFYINAVAAAVTDWRKHRIPDGCCVAIIGIAVLESFLGNGVPFTERVLGGMVVSAPMFLSALCVRGSFGGGDIKFTAACGLYLGWKVMLESIVYAVAAAGVYALLLLYRGKDRRTCFPLGPFLVFGMTVGMVYGKYLEFP